MTERSGFQVSGSAAEQYQRFIVPHYTGPWADALVDAARVNSGQRVIDVACGTGVVARAAAQLVGDAGEVVGLDVNAGMLEVARGVPTEEAATLRWHEADVGDTGLDSEYFDVVVSQQGLQYFPDRPRAFAELRRVLKPGGHLMLSVWKEHSAFTRALADAAGQYISPQAGSQLESQRTAPPTDEILEQLVAAGFRDASIEEQQREVRLPAPNVYVPQHISAMPIAAGFAELDDDGRQIMVDDVAMRLTKNLIGEQIIFDDAVYLVSGHS